MTELERKSRLVKLWRGCEGRQAKASALKNIRGDASGCDLRDVTVEFRGRRRLGVRGSEASVGAFAGASLLLHGQLLYFRG